MKTTTAVATLFLVAGAQAFTTTSHQPAAMTRPETSALNMGYVPDGFTATSYKKFKAEEAKKKATKNLGGVGPRGFQSRSMQSFQEALEKGEAEHLLPVFNANERIKKGELRPEDVPYMQRGGKWDNTDIKGARNKKNWLKSDKDYAAGGYKRDENYILGFGGIDWTGKGARSGPESSTSAMPKVNKNYKAPNVNSMKGVGNNKPEKKGLFGLW